jgi:hypothetical protein
MITSADNDGVGVPNASAAIIKTILHWLGFMSLLPKVGGVQSSARFWEVQ